VVVPIVSFYADYYAPVFDAILDMIQLIYTRAKEIITGIAVAIGTIVSKVKEIYLKIVEIAVALGNAFYTYAIKPIVTKLGKAATWFKNTVIDPVTAKLGELATKFYNKVIKPIYDDVVWLRDKAVEFFKWIGTGTVNFVSDLFKATQGGEIAY
jgi:hypothetical protein